MGNNLVIVGGGAGGASAAAEAKRNNPSLNVTILQTGKFVSYSACPMPYYIGDIIKDERKLLAMTPEKFRERGIEVHLNTEVVNINSKENSVETKDSHRFPYDFLVIGTGTSAVIPDIPGTNLPGVYSLKNLEDAIHIKTWLREKNVHHIIIIGGGFIGLEIERNYSRGGYFHDYPS